MVLKHWLVGQVMPGFVVSLLTHGSKTRQRWCQQAGGPKPSEERETRGRWRQADSVVRLDIR